MARVKNYIWCEECGNRYDSLGFAMHRMKHKNERIRKQKAEELKRLSEKLNELAVVVREKAPTAEEVIKNSGLFYCEKGSHKCYNQCEHCKKQHYEKII